MIYGHYKDITLEELNVLGADDWEVISISGDDPLKINVWLRKGYPTYMSEPITSQYSLIENSETGAEFYIDKSFSYGDAIIITFITIFFFAFLGKIIFNYFFYNE